MSKVSEALETHEDSQAARTSWWRLSRGRCSSTRRTMVRHVETHHFRDDRWLAQELVLWHSSTTSASAGVASTSAAAESPNHAASIGWRGSLPTHWLGGMENAARNSCAALGLAAWEHENSQESRFATRRPEGDGMPDADTGSGAQLVVTAHTQARREGAMPQAHCENVTVVSETEIMDKEQSIFANLLVCHPPLPTDRWKSHTESNVQ